jgi:hypothetical protein
MTPSPTDTDDAPADVDDESPAHEERDDHDEGPDGAGPAPVPAVASRPRSGSRLIALLTAVAVVLGLLASVMTASYIRVRADRDASRDDRTAVATTAARAAEAMTAIDANSDNKQQADAVHALGTGPLVEQYDEAIPATRKLLVALNVTSEHGQVTENGVYVGEIDGNQAQVIVVIDLVVVGQATKVIPNQYLRVHLVKLDGAWKVDNVENLNVALAASGGQSAPGAAPGAAPSATPSTTPGG